MVASFAGCGAWADDLFCEGEGCGWSPGAWQRLQTLANPGPPPPDPTNRWADTAEVIALGERLYNDTAFSGPSRLADSLGRTTTQGRAPAGTPINISCATCHDVRRGGVDISSAPGNVSVGAGITDVNAQPTINAGYRKTVFWNGRLDSLWGLNLVVAESGTTLNGNRLQTAHVLADKYASDLDSLFGAVLPTNWRDRVATLPASGKPTVDAYEGLNDSDKALANTLLVLWAKSIAAYERTLISRNSDFDKFVAEGPGSKRISERAKAGARLFVGKAGCIDCHSGPMLTDDAVHNVGVPQSGTAVPTVSDCAAGSSCDCTGAGKNCLPWGAYNALLWMRDTGPKWYPLIDAWNDDPKRVTHAPPATPFDPSLKGAWRTPSLRDVALTAPYMHDGVYATLEDVVWHYNTAGRGETAEAVGTPAAQLKPLGLTEAEASDLIEFLKTLTGGEPIEGGGGADGGADGGGCAATATCEVPPTVQAILEKECLSPCHLGEYGTARASYQSLVGVHATLDMGCTDRVKVVPGDAANSYLIAKLRGFLSICGVPMPQNRPPLSEAQIQTIEAWIKALRP